METRLDSWLSGVRDGERWVWLQKGNARGPYGYTTILSLHCGGGYTNLHM